MSTRGVKLRAGGSPRMVRVLSCLLIQLQRNGLLVQLGDPSNAANLRTLFFHVCISYFVPLKLGRHFYHRASFVPFSACAVVLHRERPALSIGLRGQTALEKAGGS